MKNIFCLILASIVFISVGKSQSSYVKNKYNNYYQEQLSEDYFPVHTTAYKDVPLKDIKVNLSAGNYIVFSAPGFSFGKDIKIQISNELLNVSKEEKGYYSFAANERKDYIFSVEAELGLQPDELLFIVYKKYDPSERKLINTTEYIDINDKIFSFVEGKKKYTVIYLTSALSSWSYNFTERLNQMSEGFNEVNFLRLSSDTKNDLLKFQDKSNLKNWIIIPNIRNRSDFMFNKITSIPTFCIIDNKTQEIVYYQFGTYYNIEYLIRDKLKELLNR